MKPAKKIANPILLIGLLIITMACQFSTPMIVPTVTLTATITSTATITPTPSATPLPANLLTTSNCSIIDTSWGRVGKGQISQMYYSPDGASLVIASAGGISLYDPNQAKLLWNDVTKDGISEMAMDTDLQRILAIDAKHTFHLLDLLHKSVIRSF
jgi:hypothetical protein